MTCLSLHSSAIVGEYVKQKYKISGPGGKLKSKPGFDFDYLEMETWLRIELKKYVGHSGDKVDGGEGGMLPHTWWVVSCRDIVNFVFS